MQLLVITNETSVGDALHDSVVALAGGEDAAVTVVAPALNSRLRHWLSDEDEARRRAAARLEHCLARLHRAGIRAHGWVGDADPMHAIDDALAIAPASALVIATHPAHRSHWLEADLVNRARAAFGLPVTHVVVDLERRVEHLAAAA